jgi:hypothetical protein
VARKYMIRLGPEDFTTPAQLRLLAHTINVTPAAFLKRFRNSA